MKRELPQERVASTRLENVHLPGQFILKRKEKEREEFLLTNTNPRRDIEERRRDL